MTAILQEIHKKFIMWEAMRKKYCHCKNIILPNVLETQYHTGQQHLRY